MIIKGTPKTPHIHFDYGQSFLSLTGISCPDNPLLFYTPLFENLKEYFKTQKRLRIEIQLDYFNTGSSKCILNLFQIVSDSLKDTSNVTVVWITDEEDNELKEAGKIFEEMSNLQFEYQNADN